ncbi:MAG: hypothetical protein HC945_02240, partial [Nitrosarchaeum sp.]|nr:hypothetical protein [Nitrosarchaeum sp.]
MSSTTLGASNTANGETWVCQATPIDLETSGIPVNSSERLIALSTPPVITGIQCQEDAGTWGSCSNILYASNLTAVRANITDDGTVSTVTFRLVNQEDQNTFFDQGYTASTGSTYTLDHADFLVQDSGTFTLYVNATDDLGYSRITNATWSIPWGTLELVWNVPSGDVNVTTQEFTNFSVNITCTLGECGNQTVTLDPLSPFLLA